MSIDYEKYGFNNLSAVIEQMTEDEINHFRRLDNMLKHVEHGKANKEVLLFCFGIAYGKRLERAKREKSSLPYEQM